MHEALGAKDCFFVLKMKSVFYQIAKTLWGDSFEKFPGKHAGKDPWLEYHLVLLFKEGNRGCAFLKHGVLQSNGLLYLKGCGCCWMTLFSGFELLAHATHGWLSM